MIPVQTIKVCIRLADLPNDWHCASHKQPVTRFVTHRIAGCGQEKSRRPWGIIKRNKKSSLVPVDSYQSANDLGCLDLTARMLRFVQASCDYERNMPKLRACEHSIARFRNRMAIPTAKMRKIRGRGNHF
jgi:hypothetical protein